MQVLNKIKLSALIMLSCILLVTSCDKKESPNTNIGLNYYPATPGYYTIYDADSVYVTGTYPIIFSDTVHFQIKELIDTTFIDNQGRTVYRIERYRRSDATMDWTIDRVWSLYMNNQQVQKNEDDQHFIKLVFPVAKATSWNGNALFPTNGDNDYLNDWTYFYKEVDAPYALGSLSFDSTALVVQKDDENLIEKKYSVERYARGVGMIYKEFKWLGKQHDLSSGWDHPESGVMLHYRLIDYKR